MGRNSKPTKAEIRRVAFRTAAEWLSNDLDCCEYPPPYDDEGDLSVAPREEMEKIAQGLFSKAEERSRG